MTEITVTKNDAGQRADRFLTKAYPNLSLPLICKLMRKKRIKLNGARTEPNVKLSEGDVFRFYLSDELLDTGGREKTADFREVPPEIDVIYEDENILLCDKPVGMVVHEDNDNTSDTLINRIKCCLWKQGEYDPDSEQSFVPALCNRIDRNTGGIVIAAKNAESLRVLNQKIRDRELVKLYLCVVQGELPKRADTLTAYLEKLSDENRVIVSDRKTPQNRTILTKYRVRGYQSEAHFFCRRLYSRGSSSDDRADSPDTRAFRACGASAPRRREVRQQQAQQGARLRRAGAVLLQAAVRVHHSGGLPGVPEPPGILRGGYELDLVREEVPRLRLNVFAGDEVRCFGEMHKKTWHFFMKVCD